VSLALTQTYTAIAGGQTAYFLGTGGTEPYVYSMVPGGAGGTVDASTGLYTAPAAPSLDINEFYDTVLVTDDDANTATAQILVGTPIQLFCEILQRELGLANGRVYEWDQKIPQPKDSGLYIAVSVLREKGFANSGSFDSSNNYNQFCNVMAVLGIDLISRGPIARDLRERALMAFASIYAEQQMEKNSFLIGRLPPGSQFVNLSNPDGSAIPYRFHIDLNMQYVVTRTQSVDYFSTFVSPTVTTNP
jgi:hypothetical protein